MAVVTDTLNKYGVSTVFDVIVSLMYLYQSCYSNPLFMILTLETCTRDENIPGLAGDTILCLVWSFSARGW